MISVTRLINILDKPSLVYWANKIGLDGVSLHDYRTDSSKKGTTKHNQVENYIKHGVYFEDCDKFEKCIKGYEIVGCEVDVKNKHLIGRVDLILRRNNVVFIIDMKSSSKVYLSTKIQISTYKHMYGADKVGVIDLNNFSMVILEDLNTQKYYTIIKRLYQINELLKNLKEKL